MMWLLADAIDKWNANGERALTLARVVIAPLAVAFIFLSVLIRTKSPAALATTAVICAVALVFVYTPGALADLGQLFF